MSGEVTSQWCVRVFVPDSGHSPARERFYTIEQLAQAFYDWGAQDARADALDRPRFGVGKGYTVAGIELDSVRRTNDRSETHARKD